MPDTYRIKQQSGAKAPQKGDNMRTYYIYNAEVDYTEYLGSVKAFSITDAELKASTELGTTCEVYALTTAPNEAYA